MNSNVIIAVIVAVVVVGSGVGIYAVLSNDSGNSGEKEIEPREVTIKDSLGNEVTVTAPITKVCTVNTSAAEFFNILGVKDRIVGIDTSGKASLGKTYENVTDIGNYKTPSGETIVSTGAQYVIAQSATRSMSAATEQSLKDLGITVLRMDFFGETMMTDVEELLKILISEEAEEKFAEYKNTYNSVLNTVNEKAKSYSGDPAFLLFWASNSATKGTYYSTNSELSKITSSIAGHNAQTEMNVSSSTSSFSPNKEKVLEIDENNKLDYVFIRGTPTQTAQQSYQVFINSGGELEFQNLKVVTSKHVYIFQTDVMSGPRDFIGRVCIAEAFGIDTGLNATELVNQFNEKYDFDIEYLYISEHIPA